MTREPAGAAGPAGGERDEEIHTADVVVVGAGAAGGAAAWQASSLGASVVGLDGAARFGGTAAIAGGALLAVGTRFQDGHGVHDSVELALADLLAAGAGEADEDWARRYLRDSAGMVHDWLVGLGVRFGDLAHGELQSVPRIHRPVGAGRAVTDALWAGLSLVEFPARWHFGVLADGLVRDGRQVVGVSGVDASGRRYHFRGRAVVFATGGFMADPELVSGHAGRFGRAGRLLLGGGAGARGLGHRILRDAGARLAFMENLWCYLGTPDPNDPTGRRGLLIRNLGDSIWVNGNGVRFHDESRYGGASAAPALLTQDEVTCWALLDDRAVHGIRIEDPQYRVGWETQPARRAEFLATSPYVRSAGTWESLASACSLDPVTLTRTVTAWNRMVASDAPADPLTRRPLAGARPLDRGPFWAIQLFPLSRKNLGGVQTDRHCRVLDVDGQPIGGLYAAGELCGLAGGHLAGRNALEGTMIGASLYSGRVAGREAARQAGRTDAGRTDARGGNAAAGRAHITPTGSPA